MSYKLFFVLACLFFLCGCVTPTPYVSGYQRFYKPYIELSQIPNLVPLKEGAQPEIYESADLDADVHRLQAKKYWILGESSFSGAKDHSSWAQAQGKRVGATIVLYSSAYAETLTTTTNYPARNRTTTSNSGDIAGSFLKGFNAGQGSQATSVTSHHRRYNQTAYYLVKSERDVGLGMLLGDIPQELRKEKGRNTGAHVMLVYENSPAFYANIVEGDIIIKMMNIDVINRGLAMEIIDIIPPELPFVPVEIIRNGKPMSILVKI